MQDKVLKTGGLSHFIDWIKSKFNTQNSTIIALQSRISSLETRVSALEGNSPSE